MKKFNCFLIIVITLGCIGCSGIKTIPINSAADEANASGFRYYESSPYILVYSDGKSLNSELIYLPDRTRKKSVELFEFFSKNTTTLTFSNGVLTSSDSESDSTALPKAVIETAKQVAIAAAKGAALSEKGNFVTAPPPHLYKLVVDGNNTKLIAGSIITSDKKPLTLRIKVNIVKGEQ